MASTYFKQEFVSPLPLYAEVKEEMSSYFLAGALDDVMFPKWTEHCLRRFRKSQYKIEEAVLDLEDYQVCLPNDFNSVRELWLCTIVDSVDIQSPSACYYQTDCRIENPSTSSCDPCFSEDTDCTTTYNVVHKVTNQFYYSFRRMFLLTPGNAHACNSCGDECKNLMVKNDFTFDIINNKIVTNFQTGTLYLTYYADATEDGEQLVPDNFWVKDYIRKFITYKLFKKLINIVTDETVNQVERKLQRAEQEQAEAFILAETDLKKETVQDKIRKIRQSYNQNNRYRL